MTVSARGFDRVNQKCNVPFGGEELEVVLENEV
jgi:hypothetical protein